MTVVNSMEFPWLILLDDRLHNRSFFFFYNSFINFNFNFYFIPSFLVPLPSFSLVPYFIPSFFSLVPHIISFSFSFIFLLFFFLEWPKLLLELLLEWLMEGRFWVGWVFL